MTLIDAIIAQIAALDAGQPVWFPWALAGTLLLAFVLALLIATSRERGRRQDEQAAAGRELLLSTGKTEAEREATRLETLLGERMTALSAAQAERAAMMDDMNEMRRQILSGTSERARLQTALEAATQRQDETDQRHAAAAVEIRDKLAMIEQALHDARERAGRAERQVAALDTELRAERAQAAEKLHLLSTVREDMQSRFRELADESLKLNGEALQTASRERLEQALGPLKEHVSLFQQELKAAHEGALRDRVALKAEIEMLTRRSEEVSKEATALTRALKGDKQRQGAWGEMILETLLERSGLRKGEEYSTQDSHSGEDGGRLRSDVIVRMPNGSALVIDSKVSLVDYEISVNSEDEAEAAMARRRHVQAMRNHIATIAGKDYARHAGTHIDYVVMFVPIEGALSEALREAGDLTTQAMERSVLIASPTTLMMALRTIAATWTIERRNRNAEEIADRAGKLYEKVAGFVDAMDGLGRNLTQAQNAYGQAMDRLSRGTGNVLGQVDKLKRLGARTGKTLKAEFDPEPADSADLLPEPEAPELLPSGNDKAAE